MDNMKQPIKIEPTAIYTVAQAAIALGMTPQGIARWVKIGVLPGAGERRYYHRRFTGAELLAAIEKLNKERADDE